MFQLGQWRALDTDPQLGAIIEVEEEITLAAAPLPVQQALSRYRQVRKLEHVTAHGVTTYEVHVQRGSKKQSVTLDPNGVVVTPK